MVLNIRNISAAASLLAAVSMAAIPAAAAELPRGAAQSGAQDVAAAAIGDSGLNYDRRWRGYRHRRGPDAGDIIAGVLVLGGIAAIASAASKNARERQYRDRYPNRADYDRDYPRYDERRNDDRRGIQGAVDICADAIERGRDRVDTVDEAVRDGGGWRVRGELSSGDAFSCRIDNDGRLRNLSIRDDFVARYDERNENDHDGRYVASRDLSSDAYAVGERGRQWSDDAYARARSGQGDDEDVRYEYREAAPVVDEPAPAYPGGPLPGEEAASEIGPEGDGRYDMAGV